MQSSDNFLEEAKASSVAFLLLSFAALLFCLPLVPENALPRFRVASVVVSI